METLKQEHLSKVTGGNSVKENAKIAVDTCGAGNVKSVSTSGFECK
ncbi:hypothetical protein HHX48_07010 [Salinimonas sp. HHU 13199]|uniref:Uncharacterized protein n=1 Tax=Salinimonas profundi TaxID=2729140 RepID=A0ABR8LKK8_9ALTE|nr:hypothetical protein [Salinimonas profundi]MBD3585476.1 hypothetical protein [Salinimonas profundi]